MLQVKPHRLLLALLVFALFLGGCAREILPRFVWPAPPDEPKLEFIGNFYSEVDFEKSNAQKLFNEFTGGKGLDTFKTPFGIVSNGQGLVYVSDIHLHNVRVFDFNRKTVNFLSKETVMATPLGMALDQAGNLYVADAALNKILVYGADLQPRAAIANPEKLKKPAYLAVNNKLGRLYVADSLGHQIVVFSLSGDYLFSFGELGNDPGNFYAPQGLTFGPDGNLYVADSFNARIQILTPDGVFVRMFGERGDQVGQLESPKDLAFDSVGNLYVIDGRRSVILTYTPEGKLLLSTGGSKSTLNPFGFAAPRSIAIDATDRVFVAEAAGKRFSVWQYLSDAWLAKAPFTPADRQRLLDYMEKEKAKQKLVAPAAK